MKAIRSNHILSWTLRLRDAKGPARPLVQRLRHCALLVGLLSVLVSCTESIPETLGDANLSALAGFADEYSIVQLNDTLVIEGNCTEIIQSITYRNEKSDAWVVYTSGESSPCADQRFSLVIPNAGEFLGFKLPDDANKIKYLELKGVAKYAETKPARIAVRLTSSYPIAVLSQLPADPSAEPSLNVIVEATSENDLAVTEYRYKIVYGASGESACRTESDYSATPVAQSSPITDSLIGPDGQVTLCVIANNSTAAQPVSDPTIFSWTRDTTGPTSPSVVIAGGAGYTKSATGDLTLSAGGSPVEMYITNTATCVSDGDWEAYSTEKSDWVYDGSNGTQTVYVKFKDSLGNESACVFDSIVHDDTAPNAPTSVSLGTATSSIVKSPAINYVAATDVGPSGTASHEVQVMSVGADLAVGGGDDVIVSAWASHVSGESVSGLNLADGGQYYAQIRGIDNATNVGGIANTNTWTAEGPRAILTGTPLDPSSATTLSVSVSGMGVTKYMYKVAETGSIDCSSFDGYSTSKGVATPINGSVLSLADGSITLCVVGSDGTNWQAYSEATVHTWNKDTSPPSSPAISISGGASYTNTATVNLTLSSGDDPDEMFITNTAGCGSGGTGWIPYATSETGWTLSQTNATATVYVKFRDALDNETACVNDTIVHDDQGPDVPTALVFGPVPPTLTDTPELSWTAATDNGPAGISHNEVAVFDAGPDNAPGGGDDVAVSTWGTLASGNPVTGLTLNNGEEYFFKVRAVDNATNASSEVSSSVWVVSSALLASMSGEPTDPSNDTVLDVTIGGTNISVYKYKVGTTLSTDCSNSTGYSAEVSLPTKITANISGLSDGNITLCVVGGNGGGDWQAYASATSVTWEKDTAGPTSPSISIAGGSGYTKNASDTLTLSANGSPYQMYVTNTAGCSADGDWESYSTTKAAWIYATANATQTVYVKFRDALLNESTCSSDTIVHDNQAPNAPTDLSLGAVPNTLTESPAVSYTAATDNGPSLVQKHEARIIRTSDSSEILAWFTHSSGSDLTGLNLQGGDEYEVQVRAIDFAGNVGDVIAARWFAIGGPSAVIGGMPITPDTVLLNITIGGSGVTDYQYKIGDGGSDCSDSNGYSGSFPVETNITDDISGLPDGPIKLCVIGWDGVNWQTHANASFESWVKDVPEPNAPSLSVASGAVFKSPFNVNFSGPDAEPHFAYYNFTVDGTEPDCGSGDAGNSAPIPSATTTLKVIACNTAQESSPVVSATYTYLNPTIQPYFSNAPNWNDYVTDPTDPSAAACDGSGTSPCYHGGEVRRVPLPGISSCTGLTLEDDLGVFSWVCDDISTPGQAFFKTTGFKAGKSLPDLLDTSPAWKQMSVTLTGPNLVDPIASDLSFLWENPVAMLPMVSGAVTTLSTSGGIYTYSSSFVSGGYSIGADRIAIVNLAPGSASISAPGTEFNNCNVTTAAPTSPNQFCFFASPSKKYLWLENIEVSGLGADYVGAGVFLNTSHYSYLRNIQTRDSLWGDGFYILGTNYSRFIGLKAQKNILSGLDIEGSSDNKFYDIQVALSDIGIWLNAGSHRNRLIRVKITNSAILDAANGNGYAYGMSIQESNDNIVSRALIANGDTGLEISSGSNNLLTDMLIANSVDTGLYMVKLNGKPFATSNTLNRVAIINSYDGFYHSKGASNTWFYDTALVDNSNLAAYMDMGTAQASVFQGNLMVGNTQICTVVKPTDGLTNSCFANGPSEAIVFGGKTTAASFVGVGTTVSSITDFLLLPPYLTWFPSPGSSFPAPAVSGACLSGTCDQWDWTLSSGDTVLKDRLSLPTNGNDVITHTFSNSSSITFLKNAREIVALDGVPTSHFGNQNGLCESNESCLYTPNISNYQGSGALNWLSDITTGTLQNIELLGHSTN